MPTWLSITIGIGGGITSLAIMWRQILRPGAKLIAALDEAVPLLHVAVDSFGQNSTALKVLADIASQFRTDSGSSLRDVINRLEQAAFDAAAVARVAKEKAEAVRLLAVEDRENMAELQVLVERFTRALDVHDGNGK